MLVPTVDPETSGSGARVAPPAREGELFPKEIRRADFSDDRVYRYTLDIIWDEALPLMQCVGLNPSTADEVQDDPTIRRVKGFARSWGYGGIVMTNLFAFRATDPKVMMAEPNPIGLRNNDALIATAKRCSIVIAAWGNHGLHHDRQSWAIKNLPNLHCLRMTGAGCPQHPLYLPADLKPIPFLK